jgi:riboflavin biosynthesis pyrimidine reductase
LQRQKNPTECSAEECSRATSASQPELGLVDELRVLVNPLILSDGRSLFSTLNKRVPLELWRITTFRSGNVLLTYRPA